MSATANQELCKQPSEKRLYSMDFYKLMLTSNEIISSIDLITSEKIDGSVSDIIITDTSIVNGATTSGAVNLWVESGTHGSKYRIEILVTTNSGQTLEGDGLLKVSDK